MANGVDVLKSAADAAGVYSSVMDKVDNITSFGLNKMSRIIKGCKEVPDKAKDMYVYFVIPVSDGSTYVAGFLMSEAENITRHYDSQFSHVIFVSKNLKKYGIETIAAGNNCEQCYHKSEGELAILRQKNQNYIYLACAEDVEYFKLRLETIGIGKVYNSDTIRNIVDKYVNLSTHLRCDSGIAIHQAFVDLAMKHYRRI